MARRHPGAGGGDPGPPGRPDPRRHRPQHQPARRAHAEPAGAGLPADRHRPDPDDRDGHFPFPGQRSDHADSPRVGDGFVRIDAAGRVTYASPNALSVYRRLGLRDRPDRAATWPRPPGALVPPARRPDEETLSAVLGGTAPRGHRDRHGDTVLILRADPAAADRGAHRRAGAAARRHRPAPARPGAGHQGRDHPGDPPPGEEQPADRRRAAAAAGAPDRRTGGPGGAGGGGAPGRVDRDRARDAEPGLRRARRLRRRRRPAAGDGRRGELTRAPSVPHGPRRAASGRCPPRWRRRWRWCSPRCCRTPSSTASGDGTGHRSSLAAQRLVGRLRVTRRRRRRGAARRVRPGRVDEPGAVDRPHAGRVRARRSAGDRARRRVAAPGSTLDIPRGGCRTGRRLRRCAPWRGRCGA